MDLKRKSSSTRRSRNASSTGSKGKLSSNSLKVVVVGDGAVGKTSILVAFTTGKFPKEYIPTVFENHEVERSIDEVEYHLDLW